MGLFVLSFPAVSSLGVVPSVYAMSEPAYCTSLGVSASWDGALNVCKLTSSYTLASGTLEITSGTTLEITSGTTLEIGAAGQIVIGGSATLMVDTGGTINIDNSGPFSCVCNGVFSASGAVTNSGTINIDNTGGSAIYEFFNAGITNTGTINIENTGGYGIYNLGGTISNTGTINVQNSGGTGIDNFDTVMNGADGTITVACGSTLFNEQGSTFANSGTFTTVFLTTTSCSILTKLVLGIYSNFPFNYQGSGEGLASNVMLTITGTASILMDLGVYLTMSYQPSDLNIPGGSVPVSIEYTPSPSDSYFSASVSGSVSANYAGCGICTAVLGISGGTSDFSFTAPMGSDSPVTIPFSLSFPASVDGISLGSIPTSGSFTLSPVPPVVGSPGLGGAAALVKVTGATGAPSQPLEWDSAGSTQTFTLTLPNNPGPIGISLPYLYHWLGVAENLNGLFGFIQATFSSPLQSVLNEVGIGIGGALGLQIVGSGISGGNVPIPLTSPPLGSLSPLTFGSVVFPEIPAQTSASSSTLENGQASFDQPSTGVSVVINDNIDPDGTSVTVTSVNYGRGNVPPSGGDVGLSGALYYDVQVSGLTGGTATVCINPDGGAATMQYYDSSSGTWVSASNVQLYSNQICGIIPVSALRGTPISIGTAGGTMGIPQFPIASLGPLFLIAVLLPALLIVTWKFRRPSL